MLLRYARRELTRRRRQTIIVAAGLALAVALVLVVNSASTGVRDAQSGVLESIYGVGTDVTVTQAAEPGQSGRQGFQFGAEDGADGGDTTRIEQQNLRVAMGTAAMDASALNTIENLSGVDAAVATLSLTSTSLTGELPDDTQQPAEPPAGGPPGAGGFRGGNFGVSTFSIEGVEPGAAALGPLSSAEVTDGRGFTTDDRGQAVALVSQSYADSEALAVGDALTISGTEVEIVGVLTSDSSAGTLSDVYLPLDMAQEMAGLGDQVTDVYVQVASADTVDQVAADISVELPEATVSTQSDLASNVSGSLSSASSLVSTLGTWLSVAGLVLAFALAALFTISGVTRRTRDFGTLKAIGWSNGRIVRQVGTESLMQGVLGGVAGLAIGLLSILAINAAGITLSGQTGSSTLPAAADGAAAAGQMPMGPSGAGPFGGGRGGNPIADQTSSVDVVLSAPVNVTIVLLGITLALVGGLVAGVLGGWRAARLRPAAALRSID
ncbi:ABC transporter permease [Blastococcus sp. HT6-30]|uniref:ABC transporter permease n=1 Tax=Blastococcus sp. HT6-30 TaxID=3144843 RepID=UPI00321A28E1